MLFLDYPLFQEKYAVLYIESGLSVIGESTKIDTQLVGQITKSADYIGEMNLWTKDKIRSEDYLNMASLRNGLGVVFYNNGKVVDSIAHFEAALRVYEEAIGEEGSMTVTVMLNLANAHLRLKQFANAEPLYKRAIALREKTLGNDHVDTAEARNLLGFMLYESGELAEAIPHCKAALSAYEATIGEEEFRTVQVMVNLANAYRDLKRYEVAKPLYERTVALREKRLGVEDSFTAYVRNHFGVMLYRSGKAVDAIPHFQAALIAYEETIGEEEFKTVQVMVNLASVYRDLKKYNQAEALYERVIAIRKKTLGWDHEDTAKARKELELLRGQRNQHQEAGSSAPVVRYKKSAGNVPNALSMFRFQTARVSFVTSSC